MSYILFMCKIVNIFFYLIQCWRNDSLLKRKFERSVGPFDEIVTVSVEHHDAMLKNDCTFNWRA